MPNFEDMISRLDTTLYRDIEAELNEEDRKSLLAVQKAVREFKGTYCYLEIGSHLGGSIQPHLLDQRCSRIYSIDKRPLLQPDDRGTLFEYPDNSTRRMLDCLTEISASAVSKVVCFDSDAREVDPASLPVRPDLCFIDGEHTSQAVISDFRFCMSVLAPNGLVCFHDSEIVWKGLEQIIDELKASPVRFKFFKLRGSVSIIAISDCVCEIGDAVREVFSASWSHFAHHQKLARLYRMYFDNSLGNFSKPLIKTFLRVLNKRTF